MGAILRPHCQVMIEREVERKVISAVCPIIYRRKEARIEFCLLLIEGDSRWEFPHGALSDSEALVVAALRIAREALGLRCRVDRDPLGEFQIQRPGLKYRVTAMLAECVKEDSAFASADARPHRWFLSDEARARIRRKPMRHCTLQAKRRIDAGHQ
jgi:8-oxo-dGTP pyrophosphatase MutT (NUDIX family)